MEDCKKNEKEIDCGGGSDRCVNWSLVYKVLSVETKSFAKGCATKATCDAKEQLGVCEKVDGATCKFDCCDSDGCNSSAMPGISTSTSSAMPVTTASNSSAMPVISAFLLVLCTLVSKMCY